MLKDYQRNFIQMAQQVSALRFGQFTLKSGRTSPYFFNAGCFNTGESLNALAHCYAEKILDEKMAFDVLFGPAYKGIPLVAAIAVILHQKTGKSVPWAFNRKEAKTHGEGGNIVGSELTGKILLVDDVITAGTAIRESITLINQQNAKITDILVALDRQEVINKDTDAGKSAIQRLNEAENINTHAIITFDNLIEYAKQDEQIQGHLSSMQTYRTEYGCANQ